MVQYPPYIIVSLGITSFLGKVPENINYLVVPVLQQLLSQQSTISCQEYPSVYAYKDAYKDASVTRTESNTANCRKYTEGSPPGGESPQDYIHCDGTQLRLSDSNLGQEQYQISDYYVLAGMHNCYLCSPQESP